MNKTPQAAREIDSRTLAKVHHTVRRFDWLLHLEQHGKANRKGRGCVPYQCACMGWTQWVEPLPTKRSDGPQMEELTETGRKVLAFWKEFGP